MDIMQSDNFMDDNQESDEMNMDDESSDDLSDEESQDDGEDISDEDIENEEDSKKKIQKLSGKLSYELRNYGEDDFSDTAKYATSMVASALGTGKIDPEDEDEIMKKIEKAIDSENSQEGGDPTEDDEDMEESLNEDIDRDIKYTAYFLDNPQELLKFIKPKHDQVFMDYVIMDTNPDSIEGFEIGKKVKINVIGRCFDEKGDCLLVSGVKSSLIPHITVSCEKGVEEDYSNSLIEKCKSTNNVQYFDKQFKVEATIGYADSNGDVYTSLEESAYKVGKKVINESVINNFSRKISNKYNYKEINHLTLFECVVKLLEKIDVEPVGKILSDYMSENQRFISKQDIKVLIEKHIKNQYNKDAYFIEDSDNKQGKTDYKDDVYTEKLPKQKNKKYTQKWFDYEIGRLEGDDDHFDDSYTFD